MRSKKIKSAGARIKKPQKISKKKISKKGETVFHAKMIGNVATKQTHTEKAKTIELRLDNLLKKGRLRGFITHSEILKEFPFIEEDVVFLDDLYTRFHDAGVDILEGKECISTVVFDADRHILSGNNIPEQVEWFLRKNKRCRFI